MSLLDFQLLALWHRFFQKKKILFLDVVNDMTKE